jgi:hypothetical protein
MLFVQATANFEDTDSALLNSLCRELETTTGLAVRLVRAGDPLDGLSRQPEVIVLTRLQRIADKVANGFLASARPEITRAVEGGSLFLIFSEVPRLRLSGHIGSLVSMDCAHYRLEGVDDSALNDFMKDLDPTVQNNVKIWSQLQPTLLRRLVSIASLDISNRQKRIQSDAALASVASECFSQVGPDIATWMEYWLFEYQSDAPLKVDVPDDILQALIAAGLAQIEDADTEVKLVPGPAREIYITALKDYLDDVVTPPARWAELASALFMLERMIRRAAKRELIARRGTNWKQSLPDDTISRAVSRARLQVPSYASVDALPNPLEWMSLADLSAVIMDCPQGTDVFAGINLRVWRLLFDEVEPIRNRHAHMRLMRYGDLDTARRWIRELKMRSPEAFPDPRIPNFRSAVS